MDLRSVGDGVEWPDSEAGVAARAGLDDEAALGGLTALVEWVHAVRPPGAQFTRPRVLVVGAEPDPVVVDSATSLGADVQSVPGDGDLAAGVAAADEQAERGADLLVVAAPGTDADAAIAVAVLTNTEPVKVLSRGSATADPQAWMDLAERVRDGRRRCMPYRADVDALLTELGSTRLAVAAGLVLQAAARRTPVLLDGPVAAAAALLAYEAQPRAVRWWAVADLGADPIEELTYARLGLQPTLGLGSGRGDGLAGVLALPVLRVALRFGERGCG